MTNNAPSARRLACALFTATALAGLGPAASLHAQQGLPPQRTYYVGEGQVDLYRGNFMYSNTDISIGGGEAQGGMALERYSGVRSVGTQDFGFSTAHNLDMRVYVEAYLEPADSPPNYSYIWHVVMGRNVHAFQRQYGNSATSFNSGEGGVFTISAPGGPFTYTLPDGTVINFAAWSNCLQMGVPSINCGEATSLVKPDGTTLNFAYDVVGGSRKRLRLVTNNRGFGIGINYLNPDIYNIATVCALNLTVYLPTTSAPCPSGAPAATYTYSGFNSSQLATYTNAAGQVTTYTYDANVGAIATITNPGSSTPDLTNTYHPTHQTIVSQTYANGATWNYALWFATNNYRWEDIGYNEYTDVTDPLSRTTRHDFRGSPGNAPRLVTDPLNRTTTFSYYNFRPPFLERRIDPEGNELRHTYDSRYNQTGTRLVAKSGSGLSDIVSSAAFPTTCANLKTCNQPTSRTDARGGVTDYTYDSAHGGVLTETGPAVNGVRPQTRYTYAQRYAWISNGAGGYVQAATPTWVRTSEARCITSAAHSSGTGCTAANDEVVTTYDYGPNSGPNNLLLRGIVVNGPGVTNARTCYGYDAQGNRISETGPGAGLTSCP